MLKTKRVRVSLGFFHKATDADFASRGAAVYTGLNGNPAYPNPPVDLGAFKAALDSYTAAIAEALDGGAKAITERKKQREVVGGMLRQLAHWVEANCKNDPAVLLSSGFEANSITRTATQPLSTPTIRKIVQGNTGELVVSIQMVKARSYELRYAALDGAGMPESWTTETLVSVRPAPHINSLIPGTTYAFQVRALGKLGFTDWSHSATRMCI